MKRILSVLVLATLLNACSSETPEEQQQLYTAWCKVRTCENLSLSEWQLLRKNYMLPGQAPKNASTEDAVLAGVVAGSIANTGGRR